MTVVLTDANFIAYAASYYDSPFADPVEFAEDLKRIVYLKRLFNMYSEKNDLKERLILNHLIVLFNVFGDKLPPMLFLKLQGHETVLKTFLSYINKMPDRVDNIGNPPRSINTKEIALDPLVWRKLVTL
jgi:hypothetical protein